MPKRSARSVRSAPSARKLHVECCTEEFTWCLREIGFDWRTRCLDADVLPVIASVEAWVIKKYGPPNLSADDRVCKRCVAAMEKAWKESRT